MTEQQPDPAREDLSQTREFQPFVPFGAGQPMDPQYGNQPFGAEPPEDEDYEPRETFGERIAAFGRAKAALAAAAVLVVIGGVAWGTSAAMGSSGSASPSPVPPAASATASGAHPKKAVAKAIKVTITAVAANSFTGTEGKNKPVTVAYGDDTKFGNKEHPLSADKLAVGMTVTVLGERAGDTITATSIGVPVKVRKLPPTPATGGKTPPSEAPSDTPGESPSETATG